MADESGTYRRAHHDFALHEFGTHLPSSDAVKDPVGRRRCGKRLIADVQVEQPAKKPLPPKKQGLMRKGERE